MNTEINVQQIILVDDHEYFRLGLKMVLDHLPYVKVIGEASNGIECLELLRTSKVDIVFMDINMPEMDGIEATQKALELNKDIKIIALTGLNDQYEKMIIAGACGIICKDVKSDKLEYALQQVISGKNYYSPDVIDYMMKREQFNRNHVAFTKREVEILNLIAEGYNSQQIADKLFISHRTITNHRANMHKKAEKLRTRKTPQIRMMATSPERKKPPSGASTVFQSGACVNADCGVWALGSSPRRVGRG